MKYIASCSFGKDSLAMVLMLIEKHYPLDEVVFYDTGMEFQAIYDTRDKVLPLLEKHNIKYTELKPTMPFLTKMFDIKVKNMDGSGIHNGYSWCGGRCRWGTTDKLKALDRYCKEQNATCYVAIACDETQRIKHGGETWKTYPLAVWQKSESDCLKYCYQHGYFWYENGVKLYDILDRVSCWCCANKNLKELKNIYRYLPEYWQKLEDLQAKTDRPMKKYHNKKYGNYGNVFDLKRVFKND